MTRAYFRQGIFKLGWMVRFRTDICPVRFWMGYPHAPKCARQYHRIRAVTFGHGARVLYLLQGINGIWAEQYLEHVSSEQVNWCGPPADQYYMVQRLLIASTEQVRVLDPEGVECMFVRGDDVPNIEEASRALNCWWFERRYGFVGTRDYGVFNSVCELVGYWEGQPFVVADVHHAQSGTLIVQSADSRRLTFEDGYSASIVKLKGFRAQALYRTRNDEFLFCESSDTVSNTQTVTSSGLILDESVMEL